MWTDTDRLNPRQSTATEAAQDAYSHESTHGSKVLLEGNLWTNAFVNAIGLPTTDKNRKDSAKYASLLGSSFQMVLVTFVQILMAWTVYLHVTNDMVLTKTRPLFTAFEMFVGTNVTMPLGTVTQLCGQWEDQEMQDHAKGDLSVMTMPDGSVYGADDSYSFFYNLKQSTRSWDYGRLGSERSVLDDVMFVLSEGVSLNPFTPSGYSLLFIIMIAIFFFAILVETRVMFQLAGMLMYFGGNSDGLETWYYKKESEKFELRNIPATAQIIGIVGLVCRLAVALTLLCLGTYFLLYTSLKIDLILNGLAILFILELDKVVYSATVPAGLQKFVEDVEPIQYKNSSAERNNHIIPVLMFPITFLLAMGVRAYQCRVFETYFRLTAAVCLFAGPTTPFARRDVMAPASGFCDSLLGVSCAPHVTPNQTALDHGYCIVTDQTTMMRPTVQYYLDDPELYSNRYNDDNSEKSWAEWGRANPRLFSQAHWLDGPYQDILRKNCLQLYQKGTKPENVLVDDDVGETMDGAPFWCAREPMFDAIFGEVWKVVGDVPTGDAIMKTRSLDDPVVVAAIDRCKAEASSVDAQAMMQQTADASTTHAESLAAGQTHHGKAVRLRHGHKRGSPHIKHGHHMHRDVASDD